MDPTHPDGYRAPFTSVPSDTGGPAAWGGRLATAWGRKARSVSITQSPSGPRNRRALDVTPTLRGNAAGVALERILTDNGREYCGRPLAHPYELYLTVQQIEHRTTKAHSPQTNGFCERFTGR